MLGTGFDSCLRRSCRRPHHGAADGSNLRQSEVKNFGIATFRDEDVCRLDVPMNDSSGVSRIQCVGDFDGEGEKDFHFQRTPRDPVLQRHTVQKLHRNEGLVTMFTDFVDRADIGMVERGGGTRLAAKAFQRLWVSRQFIGQEFQSDEAAKLGVFGFVDDTHPTAAQLLNNAVVRDDLVDHAWRRTQAAIVRA